MLSRKVHPGYRPNGKNIFSMLTRSDGQPWESPAEGVVPDDAGNSVYLKLKKEGNTYSGYYSANQKEWTKIYENREIDLGEAPKVGLIGYVAGSTEETAVYEELSVNGENHPFDELKTELQASSAVITKTVSPADKTVDIGTVFAELVLPKTVKVIWNGTYEETLPVTWNEEGYNPDKNGSYTIYGTLAGIEETNIEAGARPQLSITVEGEEPVQKEALTALITYAKEQKESPNTLATAEGFLAALEGANTVLAFDRYTAESVSVVKAALAKAVAVMEDVNTDKQAVEDATYQLVKAVEELQETEKDDMQNPSDADDVKSAKTGDASNVMILMVAGLAAVFASAIVGRKRIHHR